jgi:hypothetical protein
MKPVYRIRSYSAKFNLFEKVLLVKGTVTAYSPNNTCAVHCQFVDKVNGRVLYETDARGLTFRVAEYIAKVTYLYKVGGK